MYVCQSENSRPSLYLSLSLARSLSGFPLCSALSYTERSSALITGGEREGDDAFRLTRRIEEISLVRRRRA